MIPGAEYAPVVAINLFRQPHTSTPDDEAMAAFAQHERYAPGEPLLWRVGFDRVLHIAPHPTTVRRLIVTDPDDQRVIWRLAALRYGLSEDDAADALLLPRWHLNADCGHQWSSEWVLCVPGTHVDRSAPLPMFWRLYAVDGSPVLHAADVAHATAALCAAVWGP